MKFLILCIFIFTQAIASQKEFSFNSRRIIVPQTSSVSHGFVKIGGCTGYLLKTPTQRTFVSTARHCFDYKATSWCEGTKGFALIHSTGERINCLNVAVGDETHDLVVLEFENIKRNRDLDFSYALSMPEKGSRLEMIGFPKDGFLADRSQDILISTSNCSVVHKTATSLFEGIQEVEDDEVFHHNCSTYGGNSGGPMMLEGTRTVIGIPDQYKSGSTPNEDLDVKKDIQGVRVDAFVTDFYEVLNELKISLVNPSTVKPKLDYFTNGKFQDSEGLEMTIINTGYLSNSQIKKLTLSESQFNGNYNCVQEVCINLKKTFELRINNNNKITIKNIETKESKTYKRVSIN